MVDDSQLNQLSFTIQKLVHMLDDILAMLVMLRPRERDFSLLMIDSIIAGPVRRDSSSLDSIAFELSFRINKLAYHCDTWIK